MRRLVLAMLIFLIALPIFAVFTPQGSATENVVFQDDFESYAVATFPSAGGWNLVWNGAGNQYQVITDSYFSSPTRSLQLMGSYGWSAVVKRDFTSSSDIIGYEASLMALPGGGGSVGFFNLPIDTWGRYYALVHFGSDGYIWVSEKSSEVNHQLQAYVPYTWYEIRVVVDRAARLCNVWIDDVLEGQSIPIYYDPYEILSLQLQVGWVNAKGFFDDVKVFEVGETPDFEMSVSPLVRVVSPGKEAEFAISLISRGGFSESVSLSLSGLPRSAQYSFERSTLTPPGSTLLRIKIDSASGLYQFTVTATSASKTHSASASVFVSPLPSPMSICASFQFNPSKVAIGNVFKLVLTVKNLGSEPAFGIYVTIFVPTGFKMEQDHRVSIRMLGPGESSETQFSILSPKKETTGVFDGKIHYYKSPTLGGTPLTGFVVPNSIKVVRGFILSFILWSPFTLIEAKVRVTDHDRDVTRWVQAEKNGEGGQVPSAKIRVAEAGNYGAYATGEMKIPSNEPGSSVPVWTDKETTFVVSSDVTIDLYLDFIPFSSG